MVSTVLSSAGFTFSGVPLGLSGQIDDGLVLLINHALAALIGHDCLFKLETVAGLKGIRNIHAKDGFYPTNGHELGKEVKIGEGKVDFRAFFRKLHELGYDSHVTIEREIRGEQQLIDILESREYLQNIIDEIYK